MLYKNSNFWKRLLSNLIDLTIILSFFFGSFLIAWNTKNETRWIKNEIIFITPFILNIIFISFYWIFLPWLTNGKTIGMMIFKIKIINSSKTRIKLITMIKRNYLLTFPLLFVLILFISSVYYYHIDENSFSIKTDYFWQQFVYKSVISLNNIFLFVNTIGFLYIFLNDKRISLIDLVSDSRIVDDKVIFIQNSQKENKLLPFYNHKKEFEFYNDFDQI
ncbi:RDD family protein [Mycoplasmopsis glycophila]|uniref:RDD family protein n=1 Tax=Mycoplasmopsis glycophila TaxID=171285 RepID=A0A449AV90_9BACT|nr:RDD family protein [Mycoplasmopsis glycophila]VEU70421.1 RDD family protein [Mycoplasmopsis glycophila]